MLSKLGLDSELEFQHLTSVSRLAKYWNEFKVQFQKWTFLSLVIGLKIGCGLGNWYWKLSFKTEGLVSILSQDLQLNLDTETN